MIKKIGIDIVQNKRIRKNIENQAFISKILSKDEIIRFNEIKNLKRKVEYCAGRFASKEALFKALPQQYSPLNYSDISILNDEFGAPYVVFKQVDFTIHLSISHETEYTCAMVIITS